MRALTLTPLLVLLGACGADSLSTEEMKEAAAAHARQQLAIPASVPLETTVWAGQEYEGEVVLCGTISGGPEPYRFAARGKPVEWMIFEPQASVPEPTAVDMFPEWQAVCAQVAAP